MGQEKQNMIFQKLGGKYQLVIEKSEDLKFIPYLDEAHWIATGAPIESFNCDEKFLQYLDYDKNGRVRTDELKDALTWLFSIISDISILEEKTPVLNLNHINTENEAGTQIKNAAERILANLKAEDKTIINLEQARSNQQILASGKCNGDGVIPVDSLTNEKNANLVKDIMSTIGSVNDANGQPGINAELLEKFINEAKAYVEWYDKGSLKKDQASTPVMIRGSETVPAYTAIKAIRNKIDEYFSHCKMLRIDEIIEKRFHPDEKTVNELNMNDPAAMSAYMNSAPLSKPNTDLELPLNGPINPLFEKAVQDFTATVIKNSKQKKLTLPEWEDIKKEFANFAEWDNGKQGAMVESLGIDLLREYAQGKQVKKLKPLLEKDLAVATEIQQIANVEKLILFKQLILDFANDFVSMARLFDPSIDSMIQVGTLILDGRHFDLNVKVKDRTAHKKVAERSNICVMYITVSGKDGDKIKTIDVATGVTSGNITHLYIGKKGVFFTPDGKEWDAKVVDFIQQPVSISEALKMPFVKLGEFIRKQTEKFTSSSYNKLEKGVGESIATVEKSLVDQQPKPAKTSWTGPLMLLGGGIGIAGIGSAFASVTKALKTVSMTQVILFFVLVISIVALPIIIAAIIKLRKRNIGMFLEASGWAMNSALRLTHKMGLLFTRSPALPKDSSKRYFDKTSILLKNADLEQHGKPFKCFIAILVLAIAIVIGVICNRIFDIDKKVTKFFSGTALEEVDKD